MKGKTQPTHEEAKVPDAVQRWLKDCLIPISVEEFLAQRERRCGLASEGQNVRESPVEGPFPRLKGS